MISAEPNADLVAGMNGFKATYTERFNAGHRLTRHRVLREAHPTTAALLQNQRPHALDSRFCVPERLNRGVVHKNNTFFLHNRLRLGRHDKVIITLTHLPALGLDRL
jgi:hypothetical protein